MENNEITIDLRQLFAALARKAALILACTILGGALLCGYAALGIQDTYRTSVSILVHNAKNKDNINSTTTSEMTAAAMLIDSFKEILSNEAILTHVAHAVGDDPYGDPRVTVKELKKMLTFSSDSNMILKITVTSEDKDLCLDICEAMASRGGELLVEKVEASSLQRLEATKDEISKPKLVSKGILQKTVIGAFLGFLLSAGSVFLVFYFDDSVKSGDYVSNIIGIPVLGEVPSLELAMGNKKIKGGLR